MLTFVFAGKQRIACKRFTHKGHFRLPASTGSFSAGDRCLGQFRYDSIRVFSFFLLYFLKVTSGYRQCLSSGYFLQLYSALVLFTHADKKI